jgi:hypothetical protein
MASRLMPQGDSPFNKPRPTISLPAALKKAIKDGAAPYPIPAGAKFEYGTAGVSHLRGSVQPGCLQTADLVVVA